MILELVSKFEDGFFFYYQGSHNQWNDSKIFRQINCKKNAIEQANSVFYVEKCYNVFNHRSSKDCEPLLTKIYKNICKTQNLIGKLGKFEPSPFSKQNKNKNTVISVCLKMKEFVKKNCLNL